MYITISGNTRSCFFRMVEGIERLVFQKEVRAMPECNNLRTCKICGRPSATVICMHCFFNYDYRTYVMEDSEPEPFPSFNFQADFSDDDFSILDTEFEELDDDFDFEPDSDSKAPFSWLSRLPGFS